MSTLAPMETQTTQPQQERRSMTRLCRVRGAVQW